MEISAEEAQVRAEEAADVFDTTPPETQDQDVDNDDVTYATDNGTEQTPQAPDFAAALQAQVQQIVDGFKNHELRIKQAESRVGSIQNELFSARKAAQQTDDAPSAKEIADASESDQAWNDLKEEYPEWAALTAAIDKKLSGIKVKAPKSDEIIGTVEQRLAAIKQEMKAEREQERIADTLDREAEKLDDKFPEWRSTVNTPEYKQFMQFAPPDIVALSTSNYARDAIKVLSAFTESSGNPNKKSSATIMAERQKRLSASQVSAGRGVTPPKSDADLTEAELRKKIARQVWET